MTSERPRGAEKQPDPDTSARRPYSSPQLELVGDIFDIVLGGSPGTLDSGDSGTKRFPGAGPPPFSLPPGSVK